MNETPNIVRIASLIGDYARAEVLSALMAGRALTAMELADIAGVTKQTISSHLAKLLDAGLLACEQQGRHRYFRLAQPEIAHLLESMMGIAHQTRTASTQRQLGPRQPELRKARTCYDHLAGELAVQAYQGMNRLGLFAASDGPLTLSPLGCEWLQQQLQIDVDSMGKDRRVMCRSCLDWSERRHHLAGALGAALFIRIQELGWAKRTQASRVVNFSAQGEKSFLALFD